MSHLTAQTGVTDDGHILAGFGRAAFGQCDRLEQTDRPELQQREIAFFVQTHDPGGCGAVSRPTVDGGLIDDFDFSVRRDRVGTGEHVSAATDDKPAGGAFVASDQHDRLHEVAGDLLGGNVGGSRWRFLKRGEFRSPNDHEVLARHRDRLRFRHSLPGSANFCGGELQRQLAEVTAQDSPTHEHQRPAVR